MSGHVRAVERSDELNEDNERQADGSFDSLNTCRRCRSFVPYRSLEFRGVQTSPLMHSNSLRVHQFYNSVSEYDTGFLANAGGILYHRLDFAL